MIHSLRRFLSGAAIFAESIRRIWARDDSYSELDASLHVGAPTERAFDARRER